MSDLPQTYTDLAKALHEKAGDLEKLLNNLSSINSDLKNRCGRAIEALSNLIQPPKAKCSVCCTRDAACVFIPCGHGGFCEACAVRAERRGRCFTCRGPIQSTLRIFI